MTKPKGLERLLMPPPAIKTRLDKVAKSKAARDVMAVYLPPVKPSAND